MCDFLKTILIPRLILGIGIGYVYPHIFQPLPRCYIRRTKCYHIHRRIDHHRERASVHQGNDVMYQVHPKHESNSKPSIYFQLLRRESPSQRQLRSKTPLKPPRPKKSRIKDGWGSESQDKSSELKSESLNLTKL
jgi:hypothetical protein